jgi:adenine-specific DNA-methyltransferase
MSRLTDLISQAKANDPQVAADLEREFKALSSRLPFGLNFERHRPEAVELPLRQVRKGEKVRVLPPRGSTENGDQRLWLVEKLRSSGDSKIVDLRLIGAASVETCSAAFEDVVVVAEFKDTMYPGLVSTGKVERGGNKPFHTVINAENYHALKALTWTHRGKVDAIYIDPPYNTGARDWKYNNDYVERDDLYRHSKWLAFMERRLLLAKELLNPADSVLIVTIDEKECARLGLLLEQLWPDEKIQMITSVIKPGGTSRTKSSPASRNISTSFFWGALSSRAQMTICSALPSVSRERALRNLIFGREWSDEVSGLYARKGRNSSIQYSSTPRGELSSPAERRLNQAPTATSCEPQKA